MTKKAKPKAKKGATPKNKALYARVKAEAKRKYKVWPSAYASGCSLEISVVPDQTSFAGTRWQMDP